VVVAAGVTTVEPLAAADVNPPGLILILVAPIVFQLRVLLEPGVTVDGFPVNELMDGEPAVATVTVAALVTEPALFAALKV